MERLKLFLKALLFLSILLFNSCSFDPPHMEVEKNACSTFSASEAQSVFEYEIMGTLTRVSDYDESYDRRRFMLNIGEITPDWGTAVCTRAGHLENVDVQIRSTKRYRVIQTDPVTGKQRKVKCYHKLIVVKEVKTGRTGNFIVFFIATNQYSKTHKGFINEWFNNDGNMGDFSGLKVYTKLDGRIVRVNKYESGIKTSEVYLNNARSAKEFACKMTRVFHMMKNLKIQKGTYRGGVLTKSGEDDSFWDYDDYNNCIDESVCYGELPDDWCDEDEGDDDLNQDDEVDPDIGHSGGSNINYNSEANDESVNTSEKIRNITIQGRVNDVQNIVNELKRDNTNRPLIRDLLSKLTTNVTIKIVDSFGPDVKKNVKALYNLNQQVISILSSESEYPWVLYEELLHVYQRQEEGLNWMTGDMEFEAKVFDAVLYIEYGMFFGVSSDICNKFYNYYIEQTESNFNNALNALRNSPYYYEENSYPISENMNDRLKHIK